MIDITLNGSVYSVPSSAADTNWAVRQVTWEQAVSAAANYAPRQLVTNVTPVGNGADTTEDNLMTYSLPAGTLSADGMAVRVTAFGTGVNTADATTLRCYFGASNIATKVLTASQSNSWRAVFEVWRTGAASQVASATIFNGGTAQSLHTGTSVPAETLSSAVVIKLTGQRAVTPTANSVIQGAWFIELLPRGA